MEGFYILLLGTLVGLTIAAPVADKSDEGNQGATFQLWDQPFLEGDIIPQPRKSGHHILLTVRAWEENKWPNGVIPYVIEDGQFENKERESILKKIEYIEERTCVKFVPRQEHVEYVNITNGEGCSSGVGRSPGGQTKVTLNSSECFNGRDDAAVIHELLHAVGLHHEHTRCDRDKYVIIHKEKVMNGSYDFIFGLNCPPVWDTYGLPYDYTSIMHYVGSAFAEVPGTITMETRDSKYQNVIGTVRRMSKIDAKKVNRMFGCKDPEWMERH